MWPPAPASATSTPRCLSEDLRSLLGTRTPWWVTRKEAPFPAIWHPHLASPGASEASSPEDSSLSGVWVQMVRSTR